MSRASTKAERIEQMKWMYSQRAYSDIEMAEEFGVERSTIWRDRIELTRTNNLYEEAPGRWRIDRDQYISNIQVNLHEGLALYLAARRASRQTRIAQPHVARGLEKLAAALRQPMTERLARAAAKILEASADPERVRIVEQVAQGWAEHRKVALTYTGLHAKRARDYLVSPYLIEPSLWSDGAYLIGPAEGGFGTPAGQAGAPILTFKIERIDAARATLQSFSIPASFDEDELLRYAWGIWTADAEPVAVRLRFAPGEAARRVQESIWHPSQEVEALPEGGCLWTARVAEWQEMLPWVRGWGADVEVLEPVGLREALIREAQKLAGVYRLERMEQLTPIYYAHTRQGTPPTSWQTLKDHLQATADIAAQLGQDAGVSDLARVAAQLHDIGKYSQKFQARLKGASHRVDHATAGAREIMALFPKPPHHDFAHILSYCIAGHHSGLPDHGDPSDLPNEPTLLARRDKKILEDFSAYRSEIDPACLAFEPLRIQPQSGHPWFSISFLTRVIFSTLVDADWLETETFMTGSAKPRGGHAEIEELRRQYNQHLLRFSNPVGAVNQKRSETLHACIRNAELKPGFFTLTVPTGGGKTHASMAFALNHAAAHGLKRIIYVIPYTSIIEQNAAIFKEALGEQNVLEHHSNFDWRDNRLVANDNETNDNETNDAMAKLRLATENWDIPVVVTTNVQFFETLFASKKSRCRKLHNIARSVLIFDEAQMLPPEYLRPCMLAICELVQNYGASAIFCTATQPDLGQFLPGITPTELAPDPEELYNFYRRVQVKNLGQLPDERLSERLNEHPQVLCIVNTRRHAKGMFDTLEKEGRFHLSTLMCPKHRKITLQTIRERLHNNRICRVVSTQVIEAGVDLDFPVGYRAMAGLDAIIQAAGRVNRERRNPSGDVYVFEPETTFIKRTPTYLRQTAAVASSVLREHSADPISIQAIRAYFRLHNALQDPQRSFDVKQILACLDKKEMDFKTAAEKFRLIDDSNAVSVIIPYDEAARNLIDELRWNNFPGALLRALQVYTVNLYSNEFEKLQAKGAIETLQDRYFVLNRMEEFYDPETGVILPAEAGGDAIFS